MPVSFLYIFKQFILLSCQFILESIGNMLICIRISTAQWYRWGNLPLKGLSVIRQFCIFIIGKPNFGRKHGQGFKSFIDHNYFLG